MSLLNAFFGTASELNVKKLDDEFSRLLIDGEEIQHAYKLVRDLIVFSNLRLFLVDKQGLSGKKREILSVPYRSIDTYSKESAGHFDMDAEIKIWIKGRATPISLEFRKDAQIDDVFRILSRFVLQ